MLRTDLALVNVVRRLLLVGVAGVVEDDGVLGLRRRVLRSVVELVRGLRVFLPEVLESLDVAVCLEDVFI